MVEDECWVCGSLDVTYVDVLGMGWCEKDFNEIYMGDLEADYDDN